MGNKLRVARPLGPVFDKPLWKILRAAETVEYRPGFCNTVELSLWADLDRVTRSVPIHTPAELFTYINICGWARAKEIRMRLLRDDQQRYRFCLLIGARVEWLWTYPHLPAWADA